MALTASTEPINFSVRRYIHGGIKRTDYTAIIFLEYTKLINGTFLTDVYNHIVSHFDFKIICSSDIAPKPAGEIYEMTLYGKNKPCEPTIENLSQELLLSIYSEFKGRSSLMSIGSILLTDNNNKRTVEVRLQDIPLSDRRTFFAANGALLTSP